MNKDKLETRTFKFELDDEGKTLQGYASVFNSESRDLGGFTEIVKPGAFTRTIKENDDIRALFDHDWAHVIGRTKNTTLELREDNHGLFIKITPPDTQFGRDLLTQVREGYIDSMSFGFQVKEFSWEMRDGKDVRTLEDVELFEVSVVSLPAYPSAEVAVRSLQEKKDCLKKKKEAEARARSLKLKRFKIEDQ